MKIDSNIRVGQLVRIKNYSPREKGLYLVVSKHRGNCELIPVDKKTNSESRRWWAEQGLSVYV
tara:strand:+ start:487 stop:675 length:189 start_codon:yes stop_codon:yes gene_type:complete